MSRKTRIVVIDDEKDPAVCGKTYSACVFEQENR